MIKGSSFGLADADGIEGFSLISLGLDIGSATSHLTLSRLGFRRQGARLSARFEVAARDTVYRSPIILTPYTNHGLIDMRALDMRVTSFLAEAGIEARAVDTGLVVITGEALKRANSRAITSWFAQQIGPFTCVSAGARHEALLAAHGSGAVRRSRGDGSTIVCIDIGGGTTKLAVVRDGVVTATMAFSVGGRLLTTVGSAISRIEEPAVRLLAELGQSAVPGAAAPPRTRQDLGDLMASVAAEFLKPDRLSRLATDLLVTERAELPPLSSVDAFIFSGGVSEYIYGRSDRDYGDLGKPLGLAVRRWFRESGLWTRVIEPAECIRATVVGAGEYTVQASGMTSFVPDPSVLPVFGLEVLSVTARAADAGALGPALRSALRERDREVLADDLAISVSLESTPTYAYVRAIAESIHSVAARSPAGTPLYIVVDEDIANSLGSMLKYELGWPGAVVVVDGIKVGELDYVDIGRPVSRAATIPVAVKSLLFPDDSCDVRTAAASTHWKGDVE